MIWPAVLGMTRWHALAERCEFPVAGTRVDCAVSGGPDSLALVVLARAAGCEVTAWHVDHGLRPGSPSEAEVVARAAARYGASFRSVTVQVDPGPNLEARARAARYAALPAGIMTGHTADDQAETVLLALLRGAGLDGLAGMRVGARHPLLGLRRAETSAVCAAEGLEPVEDRSNADPAIRRNRVRHELLPLLSHIADRDPVPILVRTASVLRSEALTLDALIEDVDPADVRSLRTLPQGLARRALRRWLATFAGGHPPDASALDRAMHVVSGQRRACEVASVGRMLRRAGRLVIVPQAGQPGTVTPVGEPEPPGERDPRPGA